MYYVYVFLLKDKTHYIGFSKNLKERIQYHIQNKVVHTKFSNLELVFYAAFISKQKALHFEKYLKKPSGYAFRNKRLI